MSQFRAVAAGLGRDTQMKIDSQFNPGDAIRCLRWLKEESGEDFEITDDYEERMKVIDNLYDALKSGFVLCKVLNKYLDEDKKLNFNSKTFQKSNNINFEANRERERLDLFLRKAIELGIPRDSLFQIDNLYECTNLGAVCAGIMALGSEAESRPQFTGTPQWPKRFVDKKADEKRAKAHVDNKSSCTYQGLLYGAPTE